MTKATKTDLENARAMLAVAPHLARLATAAARQHGAVSPDRAKVLFRLAPGPLRVGELAHQCLLTPSAMTELVEALSRDTLVTREDDPTDRRAVVVALTASGRREVERYRSAVAAALGEAIADLDPLAKQRLRLAFADLARALERAMEREALDVR